ncbi:LicD family protein [Natronomonas pharaonis]|uniref:LicD family protein n=1 Tax=Natronomonas pharaonis TaxID=2257 RepID=UPI00067823DB|nr:LicD family protein [Natronomonas pharaonis]
MDIEEQFFDICAELETNKVAYWVDLGNLLGLVREGHLISWDDDIDLGVWSTDVEKVIDMFEESEDYEYKTKTYQKKVFAVKGRPRSYDVKVDIIVRSCEVHCW